MSILVNRPDNKRRPVDWRWQRGCELAEGARQVRGRDDELVILARKFRRLLDRCESDMDRLAALDANPELFEAYEIYNADDFNPTAIKWELEARILAKESPESIDAKLMLSPAVTRLYTQLFFDVIGRLSAHGLIMHLVIGRATQIGLAERSYDCLWKLLGYNVGPLILDAFIYQFNNPRHTEVHDEYRATMNELTKDSIVTKAAVTMLTMQVNYQTRELIMTLWKELLALEIQAGQAGFSSETYTQNIGALSTTFANLFIKQSDGDISMESAINQLEAEGARLRASELVAIGMGGDAIGLKQLLGSAVYPKVRES